MTAVETEAGRAMTVAGTGTRRRVPAAAAIGQRIGCTEGQVYTLATGIVVAAMLAFAGISPPSAEEFFAGGPRGEAFEPVAETPTPAPGTAATNGPQPDLAAGPAIGDFGWTATESTGSESSPQPPSSSSTTLPDVSTLARIGAPGAPGALAVSSDGSVFVATNNGTGHGVAAPSRVFRYSATGGLAADFEIAGQPDGHTAGLTGIALGPDGAPVVLDASTGRIIRVDATTGAQRVVATVPDVAPCMVVLAAPPCEHGVADNKPVLAAAAFDAHGTLYVADAGQGTIWRLESGKAKLEPWYQSSDFMPGDGPADLAFDPQGRLQFTVGQTIDPANSNGGALFALAVTQTGTPGARTPIARFGQDDRPGALATGPDGSSYVVVRKTWTIVKVGPTGEVSPVEAKGGDVPLDGPSGLAVSGDRLLVANESTTNTPANWAILSIRLR